MRASVATGLTLAILSGSCDPLPAPLAAIQRGRELAQDPKLSPSPSNRFACTTCHATAEGDTRLLPGATLIGVTARASYWGGARTYLLDAVNQCVTDFMRGDPLTPDNHDGLALLAYLQSLTPAGAAAGSDPARPCSVVRAIDAAYLSRLPTGDAGRGAGLYQQACGYCHGAAHTGDGRLSSYVSIVPEDTLRSYPTTGRDVIVQKIRQGRYFGIAGNMPPYCTEVLTDAQLADILAFVLR